MSKDDVGRDGQDDPDAGSDPEPSTTPDTSQSDRRSKANKRNAQRSTGPRTKEGKAKSARNATTHGVFVSRLEPITKGAFAEDPQEFADQASALIGALAPRDAIEMACAIRITGLLINMDRLEIFGMALIEGASRMRPSDFTHGVRTGPRRRLDADAASWLAAYLDGYRPEDEDDFKIYAALIRTYGPNPKVGIKGLWDDEHEPATTAQWKRAFKTLKAKFWPDEADARRWANQLALRFSRDFEAVDGLEEQIAANRILEGPFDLMLKYHARLRREFQGLRADYTDLQTRPLPTPGKNEPNREEDDTDAP